MSSLARQLILCCDGTNDNLTGRKHDTNVVKLCELLADDPDPQRLVFYDPGVGHAEEAPATDAIETLKQAMDRGLALAFGRGIYENVADGYRFLMRHYQPGDQIYLFGFSRGAFTARSVGGMVNQFGVLAAHLEPLVPTLVALYFADRRAGHHGRAQKATATQASRLFTPQDRRQVPLHFTGVWDTVASVGTWPMNVKFTATPDLGETKHFVHVRQALSLDELRAQFAPRLYLGPNGPFQTADGLSGSLTQLWFSGDHCDVGGGHGHGESALSDEAMHWMLSEAVVCGLRLGHQGQPLDTEAKVAQALHALDLSGPPALNVAHRQVRVRRLWALTGMAVRDTRHVVWDGGTRVHDPVEHPSVAARAATLTEAALDPAQARARAAALTLAWVVLLLGYFSLGQMLFGFVSPGSLWQDLLLAAQHLGDYHLRNWEFVAWQLSAWSSDALSPVRLERFIAPRAALVFDLAFIAAYAYLLAGPAVRAYTRLAGRRRAWTRPAPRLLKALGWALPATVGFDLLENLSGWLALSLNGNALLPALPQLLAAVMAAASALKLLALAATGLLIVWGLCSPSGRPRPQGADASGQARNPA